MGRKTKLKKIRKAERELEAKKLLTESERRFIINDAYVKASELKISFTKDMWTVFNDFISTGKEYSVDFDLEEIKRTMIVRLYNTKGKKSFINLKSMSKIDESLLTEKQKSDINSFTAKTDELKARGVQL